MLLIVGYFAFLQEQLGGYTSMSISNVVVDGTNQIRIYGTATGAETVNINFAASQLNQYLNSQGLEATRDITGSIAFTSQKKLFNIIKNDNQQFIQYGSVTKSSGTLCSVANCQASIPSGSQLVANLRTTEGIISYPCKCIYTIAKGTNAIFSGASDKQFAVNFNIGGQQATLTEDNRVIQVGNNIQVEWLGDLSNLKNVEAPAYAVLFDNSQFTKLITSDAYSQQALKSDKLASCIGQRIPLPIGVPFTPIGVTLPMSGATFQNCISTYNTGIDNLLVDKTPTYSTQLSQYIKGSPTFTGNNMIVDLKTPTSFPTFIITIKNAESVGIIQLKGTPDIVSCAEEKTINSGDQYNSNVAVKNVGTNAGSFYGSVTCDNGQATITEQLVQAGETSNFPMSFSNVNTNEGTAYSNCNIKITDRKSQATDSCLVKIGVKYVANVICAPNGALCQSDKIIRTCSADGKTYEDKNCEFGCFMNGSKAMCGTKTIVDLKCSWYQTQSTQSEAVYGVKILGIPIGKPTIVSTPTCKTSDWFFVAISLIITGIFGVLMYVIYLSSKPAVKGKRK